MGKRLGAGGRDRTDDLRFTKPLLYQLSYSGEAQRLQAGSPGAETPASGDGVQSNRGGRRDVQALEPTM